MTKLRRRLSSDERLPRAAATTRGGASSLSISPISLPPHLPLPPSSKSAAPLSDPSSASSSCHNFSFSAAAYDDFSLDDDNDIILDGSSTPRDDIIDNSNSNGASYRSTCSIKELDLLPSDAVVDLRSIAERMIAAGYLTSLMTRHRSDL